MKATLMKLSWEKIHSLCIFLIRDTWKYRSALGVTSTESVIL